MSQPQKTSSRGPRKGHGQQLHKHTDSAQRTVVSDNDVYHSKTQSGDQTPPKTKHGRKSNVARKGQNAKDMADHSDSAVYQRSNARFDQTKATPAKSSAYAGPGFHQSPAASALPLPSFYSRSMPSASISPPITESGEDAKTSSDSSNEAESENVKRESTPLDFLFDAARKAVNTPKRDSPRQRPAYLSPPAESPAGRSPANREGDTDFPFEFDATGLNNGNARASSTTPYKDRIEAARSTKSTSEGGQLMDDEGRKMKTAALKDMLFRSPSAETTNQTRSENPFNARSVSAPYAQPSRHQSNPATPSGTGYSTSSSNGSHYVQPTAGFYQHSAANYANRPASSGLRNAYDPGANPRPNHATFQPNSVQQPVTTSPDTNKSRLNYASIYGTPTSPQPRIDQPGMTNQQMEDDIKRFLKLDLTSQG